MTLPVDELSEVPEASARRIPQEILAQQDLTRLPDLIPVRYHRMSTNPFTFFRGAAAVMASDLSLTPSTGIVTQLCGDAHLSNFGLFRSPERAMVFDLNDFDETHPGPFEWDVKRLAASVMVASIENGYDEHRARKAAKHAARGYRETMVASAKKTGLKCWYARIDAEEVIADLGNRFDTAVSERTQRELKKARHRDSAQALEKLAYFDPEGAHIKSDPPLLVPAAEILSSLSLDEVNAQFTKGFSEYSQTLPDHIAQLFAQYRFVEAARKVVGVGSVGTRCWIALFDGGTGIDDPLILQFKEAPKSVLSPYVPGYDYSNQGQRVVSGQRLLQASSDIFLGWVSAAGFESDLAVDFYVRQLRDGKGSVVVEALEPKGMAYYARLCGAVMAQAHARTSARHEIGDYLESAGKSFDAAIADFAVEYSRINKADHAGLIGSIGDGAVEAEPLGTGV